MGRRIANEEAFESMSPGAPGSPSVRGTALGHAAARSSLRHRTPAADAKYARSGYVRAKLTPSWAVPASATDLSVLASIGGSLSLSSRHRKISVDQ